ncbi:hypothetical protein FSW04_19385 [Baekduia soli]|uniref:Uncharacterized protein n=1 Tax=Baekduia soli TaxID=496014 RepID=A0A5B8U963_9ACTN|nr:hypothetical protein [Baekduia soli]QEC49517.1 hypothetical protein FSW04_19385 [Baekduia soli]
MPAAVDLYWLPLGAGGHSVRLNGRVYERLVAWREHRPALDLYHSALEVCGDGRRSTIEMGPVRRGDPRERGVVAGGAVGHRLAGLLSLLRSSYAGALHAPAAHEISIAADGLGLVSFYTVVGWVIAGYLGATLFGLTFGTRIGRPQTALRLGARATVGLVAGIGGTLVAKGIGDLPGPWLGPALLGALVVTAVGAVTVALQSLLGVAGTGLAILVAGTGTR